jgi:hypothetical protein
LELLGTETHLSYIENSVPTSERKNLISIIKATCFRLFRNITAVYSCHVKCVHSVEKLQSLTMVKQVVHRIANGDKK